MSWFAFALICLLGWGFADLFYKLGTDEKDRYSHLKIAVWVGLVMGAAALVLLPFSESFAPGREAVRESGKWVYGEGSLIMVNDEQTLLFQNEEDGDTVPYTCVADDELSGDFVFDAEALEVARESGESYVMRAEGLYRTLTLNPDGTYVFERPSEGAKGFFSNALKYLPASLGYIISMVIGYAGLRYLEMSIVSPVQNASGAFSAVAMFVYFSFRGSLGSFTEEYSALDIVGTALIVAGVIALAAVESRLSKQELRENRENRRYRFGALALIFPILYCVFDTIGTAADGIILDDEVGLGIGEIDVLILYGLTFLLAGLGAWIFLRVKTGKFYNPFAKSEKYKCVAALCEEAGQVFYVYAMAANPVLAAPLVASYCIVSVILSRLIVKEKLDRRQYLCVLTVIVGIVLLGISEGLGEKEDGAAEAAETAKGVIAEIKQFAANGRNLSLW